MKGRRVFDRSNTLQDHPRGIIKDKRGKISARGGTGVETVTGREVAERG